MHTELEIQLYECMKPHTIPWKYNKLVLRSMDHLNLRHCSVHPVEVYRVEYDSYPDLYTHLHTRSATYFGNMMYHVFKIIQQLQQQGIVHGSMSLVLYQHLPKLHDFKLSRWGSACFSKSIECQIALLDKVTLLSIKSLLYELKPYVSNDFLENALVYYSAYLHQSQEDRYQEAIHHWKTWDVYTLGLKLLSEKHRLPLESMLHYDPRKRPTIDECISWFSDGATGATDETDATDATDATDHPLAKYQRQGVNMA